MPHKINVSSPSGADCVPFVRDKYLKRGLLQIPQDAAQDKRFFASRCRLCSFRQEVCACDFGTHFSKLRSVFYYVISQSPDSQRWWREGGLEFIITIREWFFLSAM
ncbi:hypothetical protein CDAR_77751 [Caerostris darwini]|uniref:Uncharacterized protein n=1 Tax=Caerostris darwini TaxID=1538125 RepID=A0AAV4PCP6_9ARAC|nr:hypothetical protein CDAR_77751 [Caerostris darwini]